MLENFGGCCEGTVFTFTSAATNGKFRHRLNRYKTTLLNRHGGLFLRDEPTDSVFTEMRMMPSCNDIASDATQLRASTTDVSSSVTTSCKDNAEDVASYRGITKVIGHTNEVENRTAALQREIVGTGKEGINASGNEPNIRRSRKYFKCEGQRNGQKNGDWLEYICNWESNKDDLRKSSEPDTSKNMPAEERRNKRESCAEEIHVFEQRKVKCARRREQDTCSHRDGLPKFGDFLGSEASSQDISKSTEFHQGAFEPEDFQQNLYKSEEFQNGISKAEQGISESEKLLEGIFETERGLSKSLEFQLGIFKSSAQPYRQDVETTGTDEQEGSAAISCSTDKSLKARQPIQRKTSQLDSKQRSQRRLHCRKYSADSGISVRLLPGNDTDSTSQIACSFISLKTGAPTASDFERMKSRSEGEMSLRAKYCSDVKGIFGKNRMQNTICNELDTLPVIHTRSATAALSRAFPSIDVEVEGAEDDSETSETSTTGISDESPSIEKGSLSNSEDNTAGLVQSVGSCNSYHNLIQSSHPPSLMPSILRVEDVSGCRKVANSFCESHASSQETEGKSDASIAKRAAGGRYRTSWRKVCRSRCHRQREGISSVDDGFRTTHLDWYGSTSNDGEPEMTNNDDKYDQSIDRDAEEESKSSADGRPLCQLNDHHMEGFRNDNRIHPTDLRNSLTSTFSETIAGGTNEESKTTLEGNGFAEQCSKYITHDARVTTSNIEAIVPSGPTEKDCPQKSSDFQTDMHDLILNPSPQRMPLRRQAWSKSFKRKTGEKVGYFESWLGRGKRDLDKAADHKKSPHRKEAIKPIELSEIPIWFEIKHKNPVVNASQSLQSSTEQRVGSDIVDFSATTLETQNELKCVQGDKFSEFCQTGKCPGVQDLGNVSNQSKSEGLDEKDITCRRNDASSVGLETLAATNDFLIRYADDKGITTMNFAQTVPAVTRATLEHPGDLLSSTTAHATSNFKVPIGKEQTLSKFVPRVPSMDNFVKEPNHDGSENLNKSRIRSLERSVDTSMERLIAEGTNAVLQENLPLSLQGLGLAEQCGFVFEKRPNEEDRLTGANDKEVQEVTQRPPMNCRRGLSRRDKLYQEESDQEATAANGSKTLAQDTRVTAPGITTRGHGSEQTLPVHAGDVNVKALVNRFSSGASVHSSNPVLPNSFENDTPATVSSFEELGTSGDGLNEECRLKSSLEPDTEKFDILQVNGLQEPVEPPVHEVICTLDTQSPQNEVCSDVHLTEPNLETTTVKVNCKTSSFNLQHNLEDTSPPPIKLQDWRPTSMDEKPKEAALNRRHKTPIIVRVRNRIANGWFLQHPLWKRVARQTRKGDCPLLTNKSFKPKEVQADPTTFCSNPTAPQIFNAKSALEQEKDLRKTKPYEFHGESPHDLVDSVENTEKHNEVVVDENALEKSKLSKEDTRDKKSNNVVDQNISSVDQGETDDTQYETKSLGHSCKIYEQVTDLEISHGIDKFCSANPVDPVGTQLSVSDLNRKEEGDIRAQRSCSGDGDEKHVDSTSRSPFPVRIPESCSPGIKSNYCQTEPMEGILEQCRSYQASGNGENIREAQRSTTSNLEPLKCRQSMGTTITVMDDRDRESMNIQEMIRMLTETGGAVGTPRFVGCRTEQILPQVTDVTASTHLASTEQQSLRSIGNETQPVYLSDRCQRFARGDTLLPIRSALPEASTGGKICKAGESYTVRDSNDINFQENRNRRFKENCPTSGFSQDLSSDSEHYAYLESCGDVDQTVLGHKSNDLMRNGYDKHMQMISMPKIALNRSDNEDRKAQFETLCGKNLRSSKNSDSSLQDHIFLDRFSSTSSGLSHCKSFEGNVGPSGCCNSGFELCLVPKVSTPPATYPQRKPFPYDDRPCCERCASFPKTATGEHTCKQPCAKLATSANFKPCEPCSLREAGELDARQPYRHDWCSTYEFQGLADLPTCWECASPSSTRTGSMGTPEQHSTTTRRCADFQNNREQKETWRQIADILQEWKSSSASASFLPPNNPNTSFPLHYQSLLRNRPQCSCSSHTSGSSTPRREEVCHHNHHFPLLPLSCNHPPGNSIVTHHNRYHSGDCCHPFQPSTLESSCYLMGAPPSHESGNYGKSSRSCSYSPLQSKQTMASRTCSHSRHPSFARDVHQIADRAKPRNDASSASNVVTARDQQQGLVRLSKEEMSLIQELRLSVEKREIESKWRAAEHINEPNTDHENKQMNVREIQNHSAVAPCRNDAATCIQKNWRKFLGKRSGEIKTENADQLDDLNRSTDRHEDWNDNLHHWDHHNSAANQSQGCCSVKDPGYETSKNLTNKAMQRAARVIQHAWRSGVGRGKNAPTSQLPRDIETFYEFITKKQSKNGSKSPSFELFSKSVEKVRAATEGARVRRRLKSRRLRTIVMEIKEIRMLLSDMSQEATCESTSYLFPQLSAQLQQKILQLSAALNGHQMDARFLLRRSPATPLLKNQSKSPKSSGVLLSRKSIDQTLGRPSSPPPLHSVSWQTMAHSNLTKGPSTKPQVLTPDRNSVNQSPGKRSPNHPKRNKSYNPPLNPISVSLGRGTDHDRSLQMMMADTPKMGVTLIQSGPLSLESSTAVGAALRPYPEDGANSSQMLPWFISTQTSPLKHTGRHGSPVDLKRHKPDGREEVEKTDSREIKTAPALTSQSRSPNSKSTSHLLHRSFDELPLPFPQSNKAPEIILDEMAVGSSVPGIYGPEYVSNVDLPDKPKRPFLKRKSVVMPSQKLDWSKVKPMVSSRLEPGLKTKLSCAKMPIKEPTKVPSKKKKTNYSKVKSRLFSYAENVSPSSSGDGGAIGRVRDTDSLDAEHSAALRSNFSRGSSTQYHGNGRSSRTAVSIDRHRAASPDLMHLRRCMAEQEKNYAYDHQASMPETTTGSGVPYSSRYNSTRYVQKYGSSQQQPAVAVPRNAEPAASDNNSESSQCQQQRPQRIRLRILPRSRANEVDGLFVQQISTHSLNQQEIRQQWEYQKQSSSGAAVHRLDGNEPENIERRQQRGSHRYAAFYAGSSERENNSNAPTHIQETSNRVIINSNADNKTAYSSGAGYHVGPVCAYQRDASNIDFVIPHAQVNESQQKQDYRLQHLEYQQQRGPHFFQETDHEMESNGNRADLQENR